MFGSRLDEIMEEQKSRFPELKLPWILTTLAELVLQKNGSQSEGIFRYCFYCMENFSNVCTSMFFPLKP